MISIKWIKTDIHDEYTMCNMGSDYWCMYVVMYYFFLSYYCSHYYMLLSLCAFRRRTKLIYSVFHTMSSFMEILSRQWLEENPGIHMIKWNPVWLTKDPLISWCIPGATKTSTTALVNYLKKIKSRRPHCFCEAKSNRRNTLYFHVYSVNLSNTN